ncbi:hypothetical protein ACFL5N_02005, partial [bacterium]
MKKIFTIVLLFTMSLNLAGSNYARVASDILKQNTLMLASGLSPFEVLKNLKAQRYDLSKDKNLSEYIKEKILEYLKKKNLSEYAIDIYKAEIEAGRNLYETYEIIENHLKARGILKNQNIEIYETYFFYKRSSKETEGTKNEKIILQQKKKGNKIEIYDFISNTKLGEMDLNKLKINKDSKIRLTLTGNKIFAEYSTTSGKILYKRLYNITDKEKIEIKKAIFIDELFSISNKIFAYYNTQTGKKLYNITDKKKITIKEACKTEKYRSEDSNKMKSKGTENEKIILQQKKKDNKIEIYNSISNTKLGEMDSDELKINKDSKIRLMLTSNIIFAQYDTTNGQRLYNITHKEEVKIHRASSIQKPFSISNKIFTFYKTEEHGSERLYNITDKEEVKIDRDILTEKPFSRGPKMFTYYKSEKYKREDFNKMKSKGTETEKIILQQKKKGNKIEIYNS